MAQFLFRFGYQPASLWNSDCEDSECVWIDAPDEQSALNWGRAVANTFVHKHWPTLPNWSDSEFAHWIELADSEVLDWANDNPVPACTVGEMPDWPASD